MELDIEDDPDDPMPVVGVGNIDHIPAKLNAQSSVKSVKAKNNVKTPAKSVNKVKNSADIQSTKETSCITSMPSSDNVLIYKENSSSSTEESDLDKSPIMTDKKKSYKLLRTHSSYVIYRYEEAVFPGILYKKNGFGKPLTVRVMQKYVPDDSFNLNPSHWFWPETDRFHDIELDDILQRVSPPRLMSNRGQVYFVDAIAGYWKRKSIGHI